MRQLFGKIVLLISIASASTELAIAQTTSPACNNWLVAGDYGFIVQGTKLGGLGPTGQQFGVTMTHFDPGTGTLQQIDSVTVSGTQLASFSETPTNGTYSVNPDCTGSFVLNFTDGRPKVHVNFVVVDNGNEIDTVVIGVVTPATPPGTLTEGIVSVQSIGKRRFTPL